MIKLDYQTNNFRWGMSGIKYTSWENFAFALGYLSNIKHYRNENLVGLIEVHIEQNDRQGAVGKEGRIHYYGSEEYLKGNFGDWYKCKSAGNGTITYRINSNDYIKSLIQDFGFKVVMYSEYDTMDIFPPISNAKMQVWDILKKHLENIDISEVDINLIMFRYLDGWNESL